MNDLRARTRLPIPGPPLIKAEKKQLVGDLFMLVAGERRWWGSANIASAEIGEFEFGKPVITADRSINRPKCGNQFFAGLLQVGKSDQRLELPSGGRPGSFDPEAAVSDAAFAATNCFAAFVADQ